MKILTMVAQILLGLAFVVFGFNGFFHFIPMGSPPAPDSPAGMFLAAVSSTNYMKVVFVFQIIGGALLLFNLLPVLGLVILCPIIFNIVLFHATMEPKGIAFGIVLAVLALFLVGMRWDHLHRIVKQPQ